MTGLLNVLKYLSLLNILVEVATLGKQGRRDAAVKLLMDKGYNADLAGPDVDAFNRLWNFLITKR